MEIGAGATALGHDRYRPRAELVGRPIETREEACSEPPARTNHPPAVGANDSGAGLLGRLHETTLEVLAFVAGLGEAAAEDDHPSHAARRPDHFDRGRARDRCHDQIHRFRQCLHGLVHRDVFDMGQTGVDAIDRTGETMTAEMSQHPGAVFGRIVGKAGNGNGLWIERPAKVTHPRARA